MELRRHSHPLHNSRVTQWDAFEYTEKAKKVALKMVDPVPPRIAVEHASQEGPLSGEVKESLESFLSRSDSASGEEAEEPFSAGLSVPGNAQGKSRRTGRKGRKISINDALKVGIYMWKRGENRRFTSHSTELSS